ncbi:hypothetical protein Trydic_g4235 [Trypoxylus dichotomus]
MNGGECKGLSPQIPDARAWKVDRKLARKIIQVSKIRWAIKSFKPSKLIGMDGIFPPLVQQGLDLLSRVLCTLLRAILAVGHLPNSWREAMVAFIPKQQDVLYGSKIEPAHQPYLISSQNSREDY